jgi:ATP/maltotriose-dependent transcriptional regulator MalT
VSEGPAAPSEDGVDQGSQDLASTVTSVGHREGWQAAAALIGQRWDSLVATDPRQLLAAIGALPGNALLENAGLLVAANYLQHVAAGGDPSRFQHDRRLPTVPSPAIGTLAQQLILLTGTVANSRTVGSTHDAVTAATEARRRLDEAATDSARAADYEATKPSLPHLFLQWGRALEVGDAAGAPYEYEEAQHLALLTDQPQVARRAAGHLAWHHADRGRLHTAEQWLMRARSVGEPNPRYEAVAHLAAALIHLERNDQESAGVELARLRAYPVGEYWAAALWVRALHADTQAQRVAVESELTQDLEHHPSSEHTPADARYLRTVQLVLGLDAALDARTQHAAPDQVLDAVHSYRRGAFDDALQAARKPSAAKTGPRVRSTALLVSAAAALALNQPAEAVALFERAHAVLEGEGLSTPYRMLTARALHALTDASGLVVETRQDVDPQGELALLGSLTRRERQVLELLTTPLSFRDIATQLFISPNTVKTTTQRIYRKLSLNSRAEAADLARRAGIRAPAPQ